MADLTALRPVPKEVSKEARPLLDEMMKRLRSLGPAHVPSAVAEMVAKLPSLKRQVIAEKLVRALDSRIEGSREVARAALPALGRDAIGPLARKLSRVKDVVRQIELIEVLGRVQNRAATLILFRIVRQTQDEPVRLAARKSLGWEKAKESNMPQV